MSKKKAALSVAHDLSGIFNGRDAVPIEPADDGLSVSKALDIVLKQMQASGLRPRTLSDYEMHVTHYITVTGVRSITAVSAASVYDWLASMNVSNQTKLTRLKCLRAFFERCIDNGWLTERFWRQIKIRVDTPVKEGAAEKDVKFLLSMLDLSDFVQLRDATAILLMYQTGLRLGTVCQLPESAVDLDAQLLRVDGGLIKNHEALLLPIDDVLTRLLTVLLAQNGAVRADNCVENDFVFITMHGGKISSSFTNNNIAKRLSKYSREYGLKNMSAHALRRGFAKRLYDRGEHIAVISKALGHSDLSVTSRYLYLDTEEVATALRKHL